MRTSHPILLLAALLLPAGAPRAHAADTAGIAVDHAWARPTIGAGTTSAAYFTVTDKGARDRLVALATPVASSAELHETIDDKGVMKMRRTESLVLEPGKPVQLMPGGYHVMLTGLKQPLKAGDTFPLTLRFEHAPEMTVTVPIQASHAGAMPMNHAPGAPK